VSAAVCRAAGRSAATGTRRGPRVILLAAVGIDRASGPIGEIVAAHAFGEPETLNRGSWSLVDGPEGEALEVAGDRLRALRCGSVPLAVEWLPRADEPAHNLVLERLAAGPLGLAAVATVCGERLLRTPPTRVLEVVHLERLELLPAGHRPPFAGSTASLFPDARLGDDHELAEQLAAAVRVANARFWLAESEVVAHG
jgi:hypothetical protein